ncbi:MAG TPA: YceI family protein [Lacunisphaera sp.]|nr:YceI family protein [Lacunisphaera sp.]
MIRRSTLLLVLAGTVLAARAATESYQFDPAHSSVAFSIRHFLAQVPGQFAKVSGQIDLDPADLTRSSVSATVDLASVSTLNEKRDAHLRTPDFFDTAMHSAATFKSTRWVKTGDNAYDVTGEFSLHGVTKELTLPVRYLGRAVGNRDATLTGWQATVTLKRSDFGIGKPERSIGDEVTVVINVEARLQKPEAKTP